MPSPTPPRLHYSTIVSIALPAFALEPFVHEVLGHAVTAWLTLACVTSILFLVFLGRGFRPH